MSFGQDPPLKKKSRTDVFDIGCHLFCWKNYINIFEKYVDYSPTRQNKIKLNIFDGINMFNHLISMLSWSASSHDTPRI